MRTARLLALLPLLLLATAAHGLPRGKAWTPHDDLRLPGMLYFEAPRLDVDTAGILRLAGLGIGAARGDAAGFFWRDSLWVQWWRLGEGTLALWPVISPPGTYHLVWTGGDPWNDHLFFMAQVVGDSLTPPDTIAQVGLSRVEYSAAVSRVRRWAAVSEYTSHRWLRVFYSDSARVWHEVDAAGMGDTGVAVAVVDDTTALVAWAGLDEEGVEWGTMRGRVWTTGGVLPLSSGANRPRFRPDGHGGQWLAWATGGPDIYIVRYRDGTWSDARAITSAYLDGRRQHYTDSPDLSRDDAELPVVVWGAQGLYGPPKVSVSAPDDSGFTLGEELQGSEEGGLPTAARDANGDVWVAWWRLYGDVRWLHSYTTATASAPRALGPRSRPVITWTLSEPAPGSWWMVQRARGDEDFESVARVRAGSDVAMSYTDITAPNGKKLRYRIRRECVDVRYQRLSEESEWRARGHVFAIKPRGASLLGATTEFAVEGAEAGPLDVRLYDIQGRQVLRREVMWSAGASPSLSLDLGLERGRLASGVYFLRVKDAVGQESEALRVLVLR